MAFGKKERVLEDGLFPYQMSDARFAVPNTCLLCYYASFLVWGDYLICAARVNGTQHAHG